MKPIRIVTPPLGANAYLLGNALIDVGGDTQFILDRLSEKLREVDYLFLTHAHFDHATAAADVQKIGCKVVMHQQEYELIKSNMSQFFARIEPDILVEGNEKFEVGEFTLKIIHTPGHSAGSICLYEPEQKWLFSGDTVFPHGSFGRVDLPGGNALQLVESLQKLSEMDVEMIYPGHDDPVENGSHIFDSLKIAREFLI
ncbi:MAG: MBL fold metallo-hydrolase [Candidatus Hadarchaeota archaeon]